jgi:hypothetical protein
MGGWSKGVCGEVKMEGRMGCGIGWRDKDGWEDGLWE